jgi:uncharacterized protein (DUF302 family)
MTPLTFNYHTHMSYYYNKVLKGKSFNEAVDLVTAELKIEGFGVLTEIDVKETLKKKINVDFKKYKILGACNPKFAHKALQSEDKIGVFLPCNIVVEENDKGEVEVTAVDPIASMIAVKNESLGKIATEIQQKLRRVIGNLN